MDRALKTLLKIAVVACFGLVAVGCGGNEGVLRDGKEDRVDVNSVPVLVGIDADINGMKTAGYPFIYVVKRKDGGTIDKEDKAVLVLNTGEVNRRVQSEDEKAFILGSMKAMPPEKFAALAKRFAVDAFVPEPSANANVNANMSSVSANVPPANANGKK